MGLEKIGSFLLRSKIPVDIEDNKKYNRVTIRINHNGVSLRDTEVGKKIGTKKQFILKAGQFILSKIDARYGAFGIAPDEVEGAIITGNFWAYDVDKKKVNIEWLNQFTNSPDFYELCERASSGITHRKYLDESFFLNHEIYLPSVDEQLIQIEKIKEQKISFGELSNELNYEQDLLKQLRQAFLREAMQGTLVPNVLNVPPASELLQKIKAEKAKSNKKEKTLPPIKEKEIPFAIPENWVWCKVGELTSSIVPNRDKPKTFSGDITWITQSNFSDDSYKLNYNLNGLGLSKEEIIKYNCRVMPVGSVVMSCVGQFDLVCLVEREIVANQQLHCFVPYGNIEPMYLCYALKLFSKLMEKEAIQTTIKYINKTKCESILIPLPPLAEQKRIVKKLEGLMNLCEELKTTITDNQNYTDMLLQVALKDALQPKEVEV